MAIKLNELEATGTRWNAPTSEYPQGSFINGTGQGKRDGSYAKAEWANELFGALGAVLKNGGQTPNGQAETADNSQFFAALKTIIKNDIDTLGGDPSAIASGDVNAITATFTKPIALEGGKLVKVRAIGANTSETVTFNPNGLGAKQIVKGDGDPLAIGDIAGAGYWITMIYDATLQKWVLQNPATGVTLVLPDASTETKGIVQIASSADVVNGKEKLKVVTPFDLMQNFVSVVAQSLTTEQKAQIVQNLAGTFLPLSGGELTGKVLFGSSSIIGQTLDAYKAMEIAGGDTTGAILRLFSNEDPKYQGNFSIETGSGKLFNATNDGSLSWDNKQIERVNSSGINWIRFESGVQICWDSGGTSNYFARFTFPVPFSRNDYGIVAIPTWQDSSGIPSISVRDKSGDVSNTYVIFLSKSATTGIRYIAVGIWK